MQGVEGVRQVAPTAEAGERDDALLETLDRAASVIASISSAKYCAAMRLA
jgi:hypothetical protein